MSLPVTIGVCVHNEAKNIPYFFAALLGQVLPRSTHLLEILVAASGCTDESVPILRARQKSDVRLKLFVEKERHGKVSGVNTILKRAAGKIIILISADTLPDEHAVSRLLAPFKDPKVGMTGAHPVPVDDPGTFMGFVTHLQWELHHTLSLIHPKMGEMVAFRNMWLPENTPGVVRSNVILRAQVSKRRSTGVDQRRFIPADTVHDEAYLEMFFRSRNFKVLYVPEAVVYNKGPKTVSEFIRRRRNITAGFVQLWERYNYRPGTAVTISQAFSFIKTMVKKHPAQAHYILAGAFLQHLAAALGSRDYTRVKNPHIWEVTKSSKELVWTDHPLNIARASNHPRGVISQQ